MRHLLSSKLNTSKTMSYKSLHCYRRLLFFFWFVDPPPAPAITLVVPVAIYSHHLLCFYHLQKGLASGGGAAAVAWKRSWLLATVRAGPEAQSTKPVPLRSHSSSQQISVEGLLSTRRYVGPGNKKQIK